MQFHYLLLVITPLVVAQSYRDPCHRAAANGMPCEHHTVTTEDGFQLLMIRIPPLSTPAYPVILQHGLMDSCITWMVNYYCHQNLACILHKAGYDVWMPNSRGNDYSMNNTMLSQDDNAYWRAIDMDGMALYDVPANIDYVLNVTNRSTLTYVGHSQGGMQGFGAFSTVRPDYAQYVDIFLALAPAMYVGHTSQFLIKLLATFDVDKIVAFFGVKEFLPDNWLIKLIGDLCPGLGELCVLALTMGVGNGIPGNTNVSQLSHVTKYDPAGTSVNNMIHWAQKVRHGTFAMHDYGAEENMKLYGNTTAPSYTLPAMQGPPTAFFWGSHDILVDPTDSLIALSQIPESVLVLTQELTGFDHLDFVWGLDAHKVLYPQLLKLIQQYQT